MPTFEVKVPVGANQIWMRQQIREAVAEATRRGKLRPNSVDSITGENSGNNLGPGTPIIHFDQWEEPRHRGQADPEGRRLREHERAVLAAGGARSSRPRRSLPRRRPQVHPARGLEGAGQRDAAPAPSASASAAIARPATLHAKEQLFRTLDDTIPDPRLAALEAAIMEEANRLTVGPMGFSGRTSLIGCKIGALNRLPASFFVSVAYDCWAFRRLGVRLDATSGAITSWLYRDGTTASTPMLSPEAVAAGFPRTGREISLQRADLRRTNPLAQGRRRRPHLGPHVHRPRRRARAPHEARAAGRSARRACSITAARSS